MLGVGLLLLVLPLPFPLTRGFVAGALAASWLWMVFMVGVLRTYPATMGEWGESFTRGLLSERAFGWPVVHDLPLERRNVDHVAVSPSAVLAIETKFVGPGRNWEADAWRESAMRGARTSARSVRSILLANKFSEVPVHPVLMLWGPSVPTFDDGFAVIDGVQVVRGDDANRAWRMHCSEGPIDQDSARRIASDPDPQLAVCRWVVFGV